jgi:hypothetical protein
VHPGAMCEPAGQGHPVEITDGTGGYPASVYRLITASQQGRYLLVTMIHADE